MNPSGWLGFQKFVALGLRCNNPEAGFKVFRNGDRGVCSARIFASRSPKAKSRLNLGKNTSTVLPRYQPLAVIRKPQAFNHPDWFFEIKHDGFRCLAYIEHERCRLVSRNGNEFKSFSSLNLAIADELKDHSVVLDGELVCLDAEGKSQFYELLFRRSDARLFTFDLLWCDGESLQYASLTDHKRRLRSLIPESDRLFYCDHVEQHGDRLFEMACERDLEGIFAKRKLDPYVAKTQWLKIRNQDYSQWAGRDELFERERKIDPDAIWDQFALLCEAVE